jgi:hypothetical protein
MRGRHSGRSPKYHQKNAIGPSLWGAECAVHSLIIVKSFETHRAAPVQVVISFVGIIGYTYVTAGLTLSYLVWHEGGSVGLMMP